MRLLSAVRSVGPGEVGVRVIAGSAKGTRLSNPEGSGSRPVLDRVKESWFAVLTGRLEGTRVLDLYAGVGSLGIEALSRGARECVFVERDGACVKFLERHLSSARLADAARIVWGSAELAVYDLELAREEFDLVFVDPPFGATSDPEYPAVDRVFTRLGGLAAPGGLVMLRRECRRGARGERRRRRGADDSERPPAPEGLAFLRARRWGRNEVLFYERPGRDEGGET